jgi:hypothetical protein
MLDKDSPDDEEASDSPTFSKNCKHRASSNLAACEPDRKSAERGPKANRQRDALA